jgi:hypothetical protein
MDGYILKMIKIIYQIIVIVFLYVSYCFGSGFNDTVRLYDLLNTSNFRYADFLQYSVNVDVSSTDFYHWRISINDLSDYHENGWVIMIDEHLLKPLIYGEKILNQLALSSMLIDSIEIIDRPELISGNYSDNGIIHIHTVKPKHGFNLYGSVLAGNESGDPGPYKYTDKSSPNIDKIGCDNSFIIEHAFRSGWLRFTLFYQQHTFTDTAIRKRINPTTEDWPGANKIAGFFDFQHYGKRWTHSISSALVSNQPYFLYIDVLGREYPMHLTYFQWSYAGNRQNFLKWYADYNLNQIRQCDNAIQSLEPYDQHTVDLRTEFVLDNLILPLRIGYQVSGDAYIFDDINTSGNIFSQSINMELFLDRKNSTSKLLLSFMYFDKKLALNISLQNKQKIWNRSLLFSQLSMSQRHTSRDQFFQFWRGPGRSLLSEHGFDLPDYPDLYTFYSGDIGIKTTLFSEIKTNIRFFINHQQEHWWFKSLSSESAEDLKPEYALFKFYNGTGAGLIINLNHRFNEVIHQKLSLKIRALEKNSADNFPAIKLVYGINYQPDQNFVLFTNFIYQSRSYRIHYQLNPECEGTEQSAFVAKNILAGGVWGEAGFNKWCWNRRLLVRVAIQNIANKQLQFHPLGMNREMSMIAGIYFWLKGQ